MKTIQGGGQERLQDMYLPLTKLPAANSKMELTKDQKYWYNHFGQQLVDTRKLAKVDLVHLCRLAVSMDIYMMANREINEKGYHGGVVAKTPNGYAQISANMVARKYAIDDIEKVSSHFGFSFLDRKKLAKTGNSDLGQLNAFDNLKKSMSS